MRCSVNPFVLTCAYIYLYYIYAGIALLGQFHPYCYSTYPHSYRVRIVPSVDAGLQFLWIGICAADAFYVLLY
jgi:hypothetical protein